MKLDDNYIVGREEADREEEVVKAVMSELHFSTNKYGPFHSTHEAYGVLKEEVDEMWDACKANDIYAMKREAKQVAAMAIRFILDAMRTH